jgi:alkyl hydroperoxide reductase subunit AhpF
MVKVAEHVDMVSVTPLTGDPIMIEKLADAKNLTIYTNYQTEKILGQGLTEGIIIKEIKTGENPTTG